MSNKDRIILALVLGQFVGLLGYVDPLYWALVFGGPVVVGAIAAARGIAWGPPVALWFSAGINMAWVDWVTDREDVVFHLTLAVVMSLLAMAGWGLVTLVQRFRSPSNA